MDETSNEVKKKGKKAAEEAVKQVKEAAEEAEKQAKKAAKEAEKQVKKAAEEAEKQAKKEAKEAEKQTEKAAKEANKGPNWFAKKITSLFIDDSAIKLLTIKGNHVIKWAEANLEPGSVSDGLIVDPEAMGAKIKALFEEQEIEGKKVIIGLSGLRCLSKIISLPVLSQEVMFEAVRREAERELPVSLDDLYLYWQVIDVSKEEQKVFLIVYARNVIDAMVETLHHADIKPYIIDLAPLAITRVVNQESAIILDVRDSELDIAVMINGIPELIRSLPLPREETLTEKLSIISEELRRTVRFYETQETQNQTNQSLSVFLFGELAYKPELLQTLQERLGHVITSSVPPLRYHGMLAPGHFIVNIGLVLKKIELAGITDFSKVNINFIPEVHHKGLPVGKVLWPLAGVAAMALVILTVMQILTQNSQINLLSNEMSGADSRITLKQTQQKSLNEQITQLDQKITESQQNNNTLSAVIRYLDGQHESVNEDLPLVISSLKERMTLSAIECNINTITVRGQALEKTAILSYAQTIKDSGRFSRVDFDIKISAESQTITEFILELDK